MAEETQHEDETMDERQERGLSLEGDAGADEVQSTVDEENEKGFRGEPVDPTPRENYTLDGVTSDAPTPETDADMFDEARAASLGHPLRDADRFADRD
jgi:hypothetical protein